MSKPTFNGRREALALPAPAPGGRYEEYPHLSVPQFKVRVHPPDAQGRVKRQYCVRIKYRGPDKHGVVKQIEDRSTLGLVEALHKTETALDYKEALELALKRIREVEQIRTNPAALEEAVAKSKRVTVGQARAMRDAQFRAKRDSTATKENGNFERYLKHLSDRYLDELDKHFWDTYVSNLAAGVRPDPNNPGKTVKGRPLREASIVGILNSAAALYEAAQHDGDLYGRPPGWNPAKQTKKYNTRKPLPRRHHIPLSRVRDVWLAADVMCAPWARDQLRLYLLTGLRRSLMSNMLFREIDWKRKRLNISPHKPGTKRQAAKLDERSPDLSVPLCDTALAILRARYEFATDKEGPVWYTITPPSGRAKKTDETPRHGDARTNWSHIHERVLGGERFTPHDCRRTFATAAAAGKAHLFGLSLLLLHTPRGVANVMGLPDVTLDYMNTAEAQEQMREASAAIEKYILGLVSGAVKPPDHDPALPPELAAAIDDPDGAEN